MKIVFSLLIPCFVFIDQLAAQRSVPEQIKKR